MGYGLRALRVAQIGKETTAGTAVAAVEPVYYTDINFRADDQTFFKPEQDRGLLAMNVETPFKVSKLAELEMEGELYDRLAVYLFHMLIRGNVTATQPDALNEPNLYLWEFQPAMTTPNTPDQTNGIDTMTLEWGDNVQGYEAEYFFLTELEISGTVGEPVTYTATFNGRQITETTVTGALTSQTARYNAVNQAKLYIEADSFANIGSTQKTGMLRAFTWRMTSGFTPLYATDGELYFTALNEARKTVELELTYYRDGTNEAAEFDAFESQAMRYMRLELLGDGELDSGQANPPYILLDGAFRYTEYPEYDDEDGTSVVTVTAEAFYDATEANMMKVSVGTAMDVFPS